MLAGEVFAMYLPSLTGNALLPTGKDAVPIAVISKVFSITPSFLPNISFLWRRLIALVLYQATFFPSVYLVMLVARNKIYPHGFQPNKVLFKPKQFSIRLPLTLNG